MTHLHYLTVQDILWVNLQATKKVQHFNYARLEEATFYQYAYGESSSLVPQAGRFLTGFLKLHPFDAGNESTALISCATFLKINGQSLKVTDEEAFNWLDQVMTKQVTGVDAVTNASELDSIGHDAPTPDVRLAIRSIVEYYPAALTQLADRSSISK